MAADEGERKLAAILAADVAGYSRLTADYDRATIQTLIVYPQVFYEHVATHKGPIVDNVGKSVLAAFDSAVEAVETPYKVHSDSVVLSPMGRTPSSCRRPVRGKSPE